MTPSTLLTRVVDPALAESIIGDLTEQRRRRAPASRVAAATWFWRKLIGIVAYALTERLRVAAGAFVRNPLGGGGGRDLRHAARSLRTAPWYSATVIGVIALGMALATTTFAVVDGVLFKPLPYPDSSRVFALEAGVKGLNSPFPLGASVVDLRNWSQAAPDAGITGFSVGGFLGLGEETNEDPYGVAEVQANFFDVMSVQPMAGGFTKGDFDVDLFHQDSGVWPAIISYELWKGHFLGASDVVGRTVIGDAVRGSGYHIVGIMPPGFLFPSGRAVSLITPMVVTGPPAMNPLLRSFDQIIARLPRTLETTAFEAQLAAGLKMTAAAIPASVTPPSDAKAALAVTPFDHVAITPLGDVLGKRMRPLFAAIFFAVSVLLALAAVNISGLMAARCLDRSRELVLRRALGAGAIAIARIVIVEALVLISVGCAAGLGIAPSLLHLVLRLMPRDTLLLNVPTIDWRAGIFVALSGCLVAIPTTVWPIRRALRLRAGAIAGGAQAGERTRSIGRSLVVSLQVSGALMLSVVGALLVGSILAVYSDSSSIQTDGVLSEQILLNTPGGKLQTPERIARVGAIVTALHQVPGAEFATITSGQILRGNGWTTWFNPPAGVTTPKNVMVDVNVQAVTSDFYRVLRHKLVSGRLPTDDELATDAPVVVVTEGLARAFWRGQPAVGQMLSYRFDPEPFRVVGVVRDERLWSLDDNVSSIYGSYARFGHQPFFGILIRTSGHAGEVLARVTDTIGRTDPLAHVMRAATLDDMLLDSIRLRRLQSWLFGSFAAAALAIVCVGVLGLTSMAMARRTREVGIRMALGAARPRIVSQFLREQLASVGTGLLCGAMLAAVVVRFVAAGLYEVTVYDPRVWAAAILTVIAMAVTGTLIPSLRASRVDPVQALRAE